MVGPLSVEGLPVTGSDEKIRSRTVLSWGLPLLSPLLRNKLTESSV